MSDAEKSLDIRINMPADTSGGKQAEQAIGGVAAKTKEVTAAITEQTAANQKLNASINESIKGYEREQQAILQQIAGTDKLKKLTQDRNREAEAIGGRATEALLDSRDPDYATTVHGFEQKAEALGKVGSSATRAGAPVRDLRHLVRSLGSAFPIMGDLGQVALLGVVGAALVAVQSIAKLYNSVVSLGDRSTPEFERLTKSIDNQRTAIEQVELAARSYDRALIQLSQARLTVQEDTANHLSSLKTRASDEVAINDANHARQNATLEAYEAAGLITHQQMLVKKLSLDEEYTRKRIALEQSVRDAELKAKVTEADALDVENGALAERIGGKRGTSKTTASAATKAADELEALRKNLQATEEKTAALQKEEQELSGFHPLEFESTLRLKRSQNQTEQSAQLDIAAQLRTAIQQATGKQFNTQDAARKAAEDQAADEARLRANTERRAQLTREMPAFQAKIEDQNKQSKDVAAINEKTSGLKDVTELSKLAVPGFNLEQVSNLEQRRHTAGSKPLSDNENKIADEYEKWAQAHGQTQQQMLNILFTITGSQTTVASKLAAIQHELDIQSKRIDSLKLP